MRQVTLRRRGRDLIQVNDVCLTLEVYQSVSVEVDVSEDLVDVSVGHLFSHQFLHGLAQLGQTDLTVTVRVKLDAQRDQVGSKKHES